LFLAYVVFLAVSGVAMIAIAIIRGGQSTGARAFNGLLGIAFLGYALYLALIFRGGHYFLFFYAFVLPVLLIVRFFRTLGDRPRTPQPGAEQGHGGQSPYGQSPYGQSPYGQPPYGQPPYGQSQYGQPPQAQPPYAQPPQAQPPYGLPPQG
jgi:hypothetical protein